MLDTVAMYIDLDLSVSVCLIDIRLIAGLTDQSRRRNKQANQSNNTTQVLIAKHFDVSSTLEFVATSTTNIPQIPDMDSLIP